MTGTETTRAANWAWVPDWTRALLTSGVWVIVIAYGLTYFETYQEMSIGPWETDQDGHGPFIIIISLLTALWKWDQFLKIEDTTWRPLGWVFLVTGLFFFAIGHSQGYLFVDAGSQIPVIAGIVLILKGKKGLQFLWFPILFLAFSVPLPGWLIDNFTQPLKLFLSAFVTNTLYDFGYPVAQNGVILYIDQYQLLVKDACVGLNSLISLSAVGIFYIYLIKPERLWHTLLLIALIFPAAFIANIIRVTSLILITYYLGDEAGQGFLHDFSGVVMFVSALAVFLFVDGLIVRGSLWLRNRRRHA